MYKDKEGRYRTLSLFKETITASAKASGYEPAYTLKNEDKRYGLPSFKRAYIESEDPTGYTAAMELLGSWDHWVKIFENKRFAEEKVGWDEEMEVRIRSKALKSISATSALGGPQSMSASKFLADKGWEIKRGRPSKAEVARQRKIHSGITKELAEDEERILHLTEKK